MGNASRQKPKKKPGAGNQELFNKPMENPFTGYVQHPAPKNEQENPRLDKPMENPFKGIERGEQGPSASTVSNRATVPPRMEVPPPSLRDREENPGPSNIGFSTQRKKPA